MKSVESGAGAMRGKRFAPWLALSLATHALAGFLAVRQRAGSAAALAGEAFELPSPLDTNSLVEMARDLPPGSASGSPSGAEGSSQTAPSSPPGEPDNRRPPASRPPAARQAPRHAPRQAARQEAGESLYGAVGDRAAVDLTAAFTRGFPQAASADPAWRSAPLGPAGQTAVRVSVGEDGRIEDWSMTGQASPALRAGIARTFALLGSRAFVARGPTTTLRLVARVTADTVHDGLHGEVFALGGSVAGGQGNAFFALAIGRRVDLSVQSVQSKP